MAAAEMRSVANYAAFLVIRHLKGKGRRKLPPLPATRPGDDRVYVLGVPRLGRERPSLLAGSRLLTQPRDRRLPIRAIRRVVHDLESAVGLDAAVNELLGAGFGGREARFGLKVKRRCERRKRHV